MIAINEREFARLLGYPWGTALAGEVLDRAHQARQWYSSNGRPRVYSRVVAAETVAAVTAGGEVEEEVDRLWKLGRVDEAYFLDRFAAAVVEQLASDLAFYRSPGTAGVPFEEQFRLYALLAPLSPEIEILSSGMLKPRNSLLALAAPSAAMRGNPCVRCGLRDCTFRRRAAR